MAGHIAVPAVTNNDVPASLSKDLITGLLREKLGFNGLIITDSLQMEAITDRYSPDEAAVMALEAGCDIILMPDDLEEAANGISEAVKNGRLTEDRLNDSVMRILKTKIEYGII